MAQRIRGIFLAKQQTCFSALLLSCFLAFFPSPVFAAALGCTTLSGDVQSLGCLTDIVVNIIDVLFLFVGAVTVLFLLYGAIKFIVSRGDPKAIESAQKTMTYAIIGAALIVLSFVIINIVASTLGLPNLTNFTLYQP